MEPKVNHTIVALFISALLASILLMIIWLSSEFSLEKYSTYLVYMTESVNGLIVNAPVEYNGVEVGEVTNIQLDENNPSLVKLLIRIKSSTPVTRGTVATLASRGITSSTLVTLKDKGKDLRPLLCIGDQPYPVIPSGPSLFARLDIALSRLAGNFKQVNIALQTLLDIENLQNIKRSLANLDRVTVVLKENNKHINLILTNTAKFSQDLFPFIKSSTNTAQVLQSQTLPVAYRILANLNNMSRTLADLTNDVRQNPSILIRNTSPQAQGPGESK